MSIGRDQVTDYFANARGVDLMYDQNFYDVVGSVMK